MSVYTATLQEDLARREKVAAMMRAGDWRAVINTFQGGEEARDPLLVWIKPSLSCLNFIKVELSKSSMNYVTLSPLSLDTTGRYRCEVSEEGPMFATDSAYGDLLVVVVPQEGPKLIGARSRYFLGENISINCTSSPTLPPANLTFYINQKLVSINLP